MLTNTHLSNYIRFFQIISDMEQECLISQKEKHQLKVNLTLKDMQLVNMIALNTDADEEEFKYSIINYLRKQNQSPRQRQGQKIRCKSTGIEMSPIRLIRRNSVSKESKVTEEQLIQQIDDLNDSLVMILQNENKCILTPIVTEKLKSILEVIQKTTISSPSTTTTKILQAEETEYCKIVDKFTQLYSDMKKHYTDYLNCHLLLMNNNLSYETLVQSVRVFVKRLIDADQITYLHIRDDQSQQTYYSVEDQYIITNDKQIYNETQLIQPNKVLLLDECNFYPALSEQFKIKQYKKNYLIKLNNQDIFVCFHINDQTSIINEFLNLADEFDIFEDLNQLSIFLIETIKQAKIQIFTPLQLSHMIQGIGIAFIRSSKYLFIKQSIHILQSKYQVEIHINSGDGMSVVSSPSFFYGIQKQVDFDFKDELNISISINGMDLNKKSDLMIYKQLTQSFNKYLKFIRQCYDRTTFYKFFVKSQDTLIFEFDKLGRLIFLSRPIPQEIKREFNINFDPKQTKMTYSQLFQNEELLKYIENFLQEQNILRDSDQQYQVFMKMEERSFKGFFIIFQQGWFKYDQKKFDLSDPSLQKELQKQIIQQETIRFIDNLEQNNPQILNSVVQMFKPRSTQRQTIHYRNSILQFEPAKLGIQHKSSLRLEDLDIQCLIPNIDNFHFNILAVDDMIQKQLVVVEILKYHNLIKEYDIPLDTLCQFLSEVEYKYNKKNNVFHNYDHGISVMQNVHAILLQLHQTNNSSILSLFNQFALLLSGLCHDVSHTGRTNTFEINSLSNLAIRYHDRSVLEQHHAAKSLKLLCVPNTNILQSLKGEEFRKFRRIFISNILYTDITEHFNLIKNFETKILEQNFGSQDEDIKLLSGMIIHTSDFTGGAKQFELSKQWSFKVNKEFEQQYELEGKLGYPQLPYMKDLHNLSVMAKQEAGFFKFIVRPLWQSMSKYLDNRLQKQVEYLDETIQKWEQIANSE
ncbi:unnamed protein product [Paramecium pentaurelia]|uniref:Phosphodiesterase n=1 Tax=Paramecium pentaurelia TaxID=43138 RepID=A0A8S1XKT4_9CILI|nr:unnamed protein product [Paramecium pentaurelia]